MSRIISTPITAIATAIVFMSEKNALLSIKSDSNKPARTAGIEVIIMLISSL